MQYSSRTGPITNNQATFEPSMVEGYQPDRGHKFVRQLGLQLAQPTHVQAPLSTDMVEGALVDRNRERLQGHYGWQFVAPTVDQFSIEMVEGWRPDAPRLFLAPRLLFPLSQPTHTEAAF